MTTKHEGKCKKCLKLQQDKVCQICPNCHTEVTGAGVREDKRECGHTEMLHWKKCSDCREYMVTEDFEARLSLLHSQIVEEVEKREGVPNDVWSTGYNKGLEQVKEIINQAFKEL